MDSKIKLTNPFGRGLKVRRYTEFSKKLAAPVRALLIADLHSTLYGCDQKILLDAIYKQHPDLILLAGDIADHRVDHKGTRQLIAGIGKTYPCFYVSGNHEQWTGQMAMIKNMFRSGGITVLDGKVVLTEVAGETLQLGGVDDPHAYTSSHHAVRLDSKWKKQFWSCCSELKSEYYSILLSHRPELVKYYKDSGFDLVTAGHAHGGQICIPGYLNGLFAPHQGFFPQYAGGQYRLGSTSLIVSRGLCLNHLPRIFNPPELVVIDLKPDSFKENNKSTGSNQHGESTGKSYTTRFNSRKTGCKTKRRGDQKKTLGTTAEKTSSG